MGIAKDRELVDELCAISYGLTEWEMSFIDSIAKHVHDDKRVLSEDQRKKAEEIRESKGE